MHPSKGSVAMPLDKSLLSEHTLYYMTRVLQWK